MRVSSSILNALKISNFQIFNLKNLRKSSSMEEDFSSVLFLFFNLSLSVISFRTIFIVFSLAFLFCIFKQISNIFVSFHIFHLHNFFILRYNDKIMIATVRYGMLEMIRKPHKGTYPIQISSFY